MNAFARYDAQGRLVEERPLTIAEAAERHGLGAKAVPTADEVARRWYLVRRTVRTDGHALEWLKRCRLAFYYPMMRELRPVPRRRLSARQRASGVALMRPRKVPLFPGYIFVRMNLAADAWSIVSSIAGVGGLVCEGGLPVEMSAGLVDAILAREIDGVVPGKTPAALIFRPGDAVRICDGALSGLIATIEQTPDYTVADIDGDTRIKVAVEMFGVPTPVDLTFAQIEKL